MNNPVILALDGNPGTPVRDAQDLKEIRTLEVTGYQVLADSRGNIHVILIHEGGELKFLADARSAKGLAMQLTIAALKIEPELPYIER